jgi:hypothetical protein
MVVMSHKNAKRGRIARRMAPRSNPQLVELLAEHLGWLERSGAAFDSGLEDEAKRLAVVIRTLVHDTAASSSLLGQVGLKSRIHFVDSADPILPGNLAPTLGLVMLRISTADGGSYVPHLGDGPPDLYGRTLAFDRWWNAPVAKLQDGRTISRREFVMPIVNREGGAHVDPQLDAMFDDFVRRNPFGWVQARTTDDGGTVVPIDGNGALACVRQIAWELEQTIRPYVPATIP